MSNAGGMSTVTRYTDMLAGNPVFVDNSYESISTVTVGAGGSSSIDFTSIPSTYKHLQIRVAALTSSSADTYIRVNTLTTGYPQHILYGTGSTASSYADTSSYSGFVWLLNGSGTTTAPVVGIIDVLDYSATTKNKTFKSINGWDANGSGQIQLSSGFSTSLGTSAITSISIVRSSGSFSQYSSFALYGIKG